MRRSFWSKEERRATGGEGIAWFEGDIRGLAFQFLPINGWLPEASPG